MWAHLLLTRDIESIWALTPQERAGGVYAAEPFVLVTFAPWEENKTINIYTDSTVGVCSEDH